MSPERPTELRNILPPVMLLLLGVFILLALLYVLPGLNPHRPAVFKLTGTMALLAYGMTMTGGAIGATLVSMLLIVIFISRNGPTARQRISEASLMALCLLILLGGGAYTNEHVVKPIFHTPRPNILELSTTPTQSPALGISAESFYQLPDKSSRSAHLEQVLSVRHNDIMALHPRIRDHWIAETGFSFPSGHSYASILLATLFLALGFSSFKTRRWWWCLPMLWAAGVCYSRAFLRVHSPTDIFVGAAWGVVMGLGAFLVVRSSRIMVMSIANRS